MYPGTVPMRNCARPVIHRIQEFRPVLTAREPRGGNAFKEQKRNRAALEHAGEPPTKWRREETSPCGPLTSN